MRGRAGILSASAGLAPMTLDYVTKNVLTTTDGTALDNYTWTGLSFGAVAADRDIIVLIGYEEDISDVLTVTIGGVAAAIAIGRRRGTPTPDIGAWIAFARVPTGTTGDVIVTWGAAIKNRDIGIAVYRATGMAGLCDSLDVTGTAVDHTQAIAVVAGGGAIGADVNSSSRTHTWSVLAEDFDDNTSASFSFSGAHALTAGSSSASTMGATASGAIDDFVGGLASFGPAVTWGINRTPIVLSSDFSTNRTIAANVGASAALTIGEASANRYVYAFIRCKDLDGNDISAVTIGGITAAKAVGVVDTAPAPDVLFQCWYANVPTGTTAVVSATFTGATGHADFGALSIRDVNVPVVDTATAVVVAAAAANNNQIDISAGGLVIVGATLQGTSAAINGAAIVSSTANLFAASVEEFDSQGIGVGRMRALASAANADVDVPFPASSDHQVILISLR